MANKKQSNRLSIYPFSEARKQTARRKLEQQSQHAAEAQKNDFLMGWEGEFFGKDFLTFNKMIGLPVNIKTGKPTEIFDYELALFDVLQSHKQVWIKKARGLGITEFLLRYMAWLCLCDNSMRGCQMAIVTGIRLETAVDSINRIKRLFDPTKYPLPQTRDTRVMINGCLITGYPSNANSSRGQEAMKFILLDEADYFEGRDQLIARESSEGYIAKSRPWIVMNSTPNLPGGVYEQIEKDPNSIYFKHYMHYSLGVGKIYSQEDIEEARKSPNFPREYELQYGSGIGNIFPQELLTKCCDSTYSLQVGHGYNIVLCCDPAYGSSNFGIVCMEQRSNDGLTYVMLAEQFERPSPSAMLERVIHYCKNVYGHCPVLVDSAHPGLITDLVDNGITAMPINFQKELSAMTITAAQAVRAANVRLNPQAHQELIAQLRAVTFNQKGHPDKTRLNFDLGDAFLMGISYIGQGAGGGWGDLGNS